MGSWRLAARGTGLGMTRGMQPRWGRQHIERGVLDELLLEQLPSPALRAKATAMWSRARPVAEESA
ncbi:MAG: hypothetical protein H7269_02615 [Cellulomonas sp.]|nr:hypothetical protein [Cellulomonas sp.]